MVQSSVRLVAAKVLLVIREFGGPEPHAVSYHEVLRHRGAAAPGRERTNCGGRRRPAGLTRA
jgi:hypothetical protein